MALLAAVLLRDIINMVLQAVLLVVLPNIMAIISILHLNSKDIISILPKAALLSHITSRPINTPRLITPHHLD